MAYKFKDYEEGADVQAARDALAATQAAKPGEYQSQWTQQLNDTMQQILDRKDFNYSLNGDALWQQYKDAYTRQGKLGMQNAMGQAAALTGGYGNSYAQQVGQQTYQGYMQQLNDRIPELYQMAMQKYQLDASNLAQKYGALGDREGQDYSRYQDALGNWRNDLNYATGRYDTASNTDYSRYQDAASKDWTAFQYNQQQAAAQVQYYLANGQTPPAALVAQADLDPNYVNRVIANQQAAKAAAAAASSGGGGGRRSGGADDEVSEGAKATTQAAWAAVDYLSKGAPPQTVVNALRNSGMDLDEAQEALHRATQIIQSGKNAGGMR